VIRNKGVDRSGWWVVSAAWRGAQADARSFQLRAYDAVYLELARREGWPLATLDKRLRTAAASGNPGDVVIVVKVGREDRKTQKNGGFAQCPGDLHRSLPKYLGGGLDELTEPGIIIDGLGVDQAFRGITVGSKRRFFPA
jgi:hypothetical protein